MLAPCTDEAKLRRRPAMSKTKPARDQNDVSGRHVQAPSQALDNRPIIVSRRGVCEAGPMPVPKQRLSKMPMTRRRLRRLVSVSVRRLGTVEAASGVAGAKHRRRPSGPPFPSGSDAQRSEAGSSPARRRRSSEGCWPAAASCHRRPLEWLPFQPAPGHEGAALRRARATREAV